MRSLPSVHETMDHPELTRVIETHGRDLVLDWVREILSDLRTELRAGEIADNREDHLRAIVERITQRTARMQARRPGRVINATGIVLHTGLGRAPLSEAARSAINECSQAGNVEVDLETGERHQRGYQLVDDFRHLTGCDDALIVNNNAAATLLALTALGRNETSSEPGEVLISRGQLVEIGGSYRLPDVFAASGATMREVGTTNRTRVTDYENAITERTVAVLRVHPSNYRIVGFSEMASTAELSGLCRKQNLLLIDDIGSGAMVDPSEIGLRDEPTFRSSLAAGADVVLGSADKLLGGPQAGIVLGRNEPLDRMRSHPIARTVRIGKLTLAALAATLDSYRRDVAWTEIPTLQMLRTPVKELRSRAEQLAERLRDRDDLELDIIDDHAPVGGGSLPGAELPTVTVVLRHRSITADEFARELRLSTPRVMGRISRDAVILDLRSLLSDDDDDVVAAVQRVIGS